jgi:hypothetical protein
LEVYEPDSDDLHADFIQNIPFPRISEGEEILLLGIKSEIVKVQSVENNIEVGTGPTKKNIFLPNHN